MIFLNVDDDDVVVIGIYNMYFNEKKKKEPLWNKNKKRSIQQLIG